MTFLGNYYLHENGELIYKPHGVDPQDAADSTFVKHVWCCEEMAVSPHNFVNFLKDAYSRGANVTAITELAKNMKLKEFVPDWYVKVGLHEA